MIGKWHINNYNNRYFKKDTLTLTANNKTCREIRWEFSKKEFRIWDVNTCKEPPISSSSIFKENLNLKKTDFGQIIEISRNSEVINSYKILDEFNTSRFKILKFDKLEDEKLFKYVDSLIFKVLKYKPTNEIKISNIKIRDSFDRNFEPLIVVNGYPIDQKNILKEILLVEAYKITYITKEQASSIYGMRAINGVIILNISEKKFKKALKKYSG